MSTGFILKERYFWRYLLFVLILVFAVLFGRDYDPPTQGEAALLRQIDQINEEKKGIYEISAATEKVEIKEPVTVASGSFYRFLFTLRFLPTDNDAAKINGSEATFELIFRSDFGDEESIGTVTLNQAAPEQFEFDFAPSNRGGNIFLHRKGGVERGARFSDLRYYELDVRSREDLNRLNSTLSGAKSQLIPTAGHPLEAQQTSWRFSRRNQEVGQVFTASEDNIIAVDLALLYHGTGGRGQYHLELRAMTGDNVDLTREHIAYYYFEKDKADDLLVDKKNNIYRFPLAAHLKGGDKYYLSLDNSDVDFNYLNTISLVGNRSNGSEVIHSVKGKRHNEPGQLFYQTYASKFWEKDGERILNNALIQDFGGGKGHYTYDMTGEAKDFLDLHDYSQDIRRQLVFYDSVQGGLSGQAVGDTSFIYKFHTFYPYGLAVVNIKQTAPEFTNCSVYLSTDGQNWRKVDRLTENKLIFNQRFDGGGKEKNIFLKVTYDPTDTIEQKIKLFGITQLRVEAELKIK